jgi:hypothetical protein
VDVQVEDGDSAPAFLRGTDGEVKQGRCRPYPRCQAGEKDRLGRSVDLVWEYLGEQAAIPTASGVVGLMEADQIRKWDGRRRLTRVVCHEEWSGLGERGTGRLRLRLLAGRGGFGTGFSGGRGQDVCGRLKAVLRAPDLDEGDRLDHATFRRFGRRDGLAGLREFGLRQALRVKNPSHVVAPSRPPW